MRLATIVALLLASASPAIADHHTGKDPKSDGLVIAAGGGVETFVAREFQQVAKGGQSWDARLSLGGNEDIRFEVVYVGSRHALAPGQGDVLLGHGVRGILRINVAPWLRAVEPFIYVGAGWTRFHVQGRTETSMLTSDTDDVLCIPFGVGVARRFAHRFVVDARFTVEAVTSADMVPVERDPTTSNDNASMNRIAGMVHVGVEL